MKTTITENVKFEINRIFGSTQLNNISKMFSVTNFPIISKNDNERVQLAILLGSEGNMEKFNEFLELSKIDWRDTLMNTGLANEDWKRVLYEKGFRCFNHIVELIFLQVKIFLEENLRLRNFKKTEEKYHPESFGSRYIQFDKENRSIRFVWDGKEEWFLSEWCDDISEQFFLNWIKIKLIKFNKTNPEDIKNISNRFIRSFNDFLDNKNCATVR